MGQKIKKCYSIDEQDAGRISRLSSEMGLPESEILNKIIHLGFAQKIELTTVERYHYQRIVIIEAIDSILLTYGISHYEGSLSAKFGMLLISMSGFSRTKNRDFRKKIQETSIFEVLNKIKTWDIDLYKSLVSDMGSFGRIKDRYLQSISK